MIYWSPLCPSIMDMVRGAPINLRTSHAKNRFSALFCSGFQFRRSDNVYPVSGNDLPVDVLPSVPVTGFLGRRRELPSTGNKRHFRCEIKWFHCLCELTMLNPLCPAENGLKMFTFLRCDCIMGSNEFYGPIHLLASRIPLAGNGHRNSRDHFAYGFSKKIKDEKWKCVMLRRTFHSNHNFGRTREQTCGHKNRIYF